VQVSVNPGQAEYEYLLRAQECLIEARRYLAWQGQLVLPELGQRVVEIGCGIGNFTELLLDRQTLLCVDREPAYLQRLHERFPRHANLHSFALDAGTDDLSKLIRFQPDSCVALNVVEHIEGDRQALANIASILSPGGVIVLTVPAFPALYGPVDHNLGHYRRYTRTSLSRVAEAAGLRMRKSRYFNSVGFFGWWFHAHVTRLQVHPQSQIKTFDRWIVPWLSRAEAFAAPPFGQSLLAVLEKV
jgi:SAM-dependent methyltransferase